MPPKAKITKEMIINAAFDIAREKGVENINVRSVAERLGCSTQPVMYHFKKVEDIRKAVYEKADQYHLECLMKIEYENPIMGIGMNYIQFANSEKLLFRLLFQTDYFNGMSITEITEDEELSSIIHMFAENIKITYEQAKKLFKALFLYVHGYASMLANNSMKYDEEVAIQNLSFVYDGLVAAVTKGEMINEKII